MKTYSKSMEEYGSWSLDTDFYIILDIGNSRTKMFVTGEDAILYSATYDTVADLEKIFVIFPQIKNGIYSASGQIPDEMENFLHSKLDYLLHFTSDTPVPLTNLYKSPETLGSDRLAAAIGVNCFFPNTNLMIFDFGTAITIDFVDSNNNYLGGNISPGLSMRLKSLNFFTNRLPLVQIPGKIDEIGTTTNEAIAIGVVRGIIGETMYYINKYPDHKIFFTGGDYFYFAKKIKTTTFVFRNPVVFGLNRILHHNLELCFVK
ncbi:MAG: type III pantothenate kinase [Prevotellaceae bacterium]|jgi:type III pantothenate kinase|nr:type III pantothenate kinase [Prevotellaceae bacterium]